MINIYLSSFQVPNYRHLRHRSSYGKHKIKLTTCVTYLLISSSQYYIINYLEKRNIEKENLEKEED